MDDSLISISTLALITFSYIQCVYIIVERLQSPTCLHKLIFVMFCHRSLSVFFDCTYGYNKASVSAIMRTTYHRHIAALKLEIS